MSIRTLNIILISVFTFLCTLNTNAENPVDSLSITDSNIGIETTKLPLILVSLGDVNTFKSQTKLVSEENISVKVYKYFYVGITLKNSVKSTWRTDRYIGHIYSMSWEFLIEALSNPIFKRNHFSIGFSGNIGYGNLLKPEYSYEPLKMNSQFNPDEFQINRNYLTGTIGLYFRYYGLFLSLGYQLNNMDLDPINRRNGLFRKPTVHGLLVAFRIGLW